ncbi:hypothetical protein NE236_37460 [Actinoallomurus purpureus]|uniref:hypothetical protein n=1 Tax=Actinoallomurus purpureus TaxID=478114 RepID=UPI0020920ECC|nr:hypothetical protein [Actinoallomurus purpureus]MCO6010661.1 hypothetical protein [Actinoallomurus purpureus]
MTGDQLVPRKKSYEEKFAERIAKRDAERGPLKDGKVFEHGPAKFLFMFIIGFVIVTHVAILIVMMASGMR